MLSDVGGAGDGRCRRALGCTAEIDALHAILDRGTSADEQLGVYRDALAGGASQPQALASVVGWLAETTVH